MDKVIIITGASRGIGRATAKLLAESGYKVIADYNKSEDKALSLKEELASKGIEIDIFKADVSKREECKALAEFAYNKYGKIDVLVNNAGIDQEKMFQDISDEDWNEIIKVDLYSVFCMTQEALPTFLHNKNGCIINISSIYGVSGGACAVAYSAAKAGIIGLTKSLAKELGPSNIRVNAIAPGCINTDMISCYTKEELEDVKKEIPLNKIGNPSDIAKCVKWLADDEYTTGQVISINGGWDI
jgi:3-oxoacyl-[acyl-carrier protein] reductase